MTMENRHVKVITPDGLTESFYTQGIERSCGFYITTPVSYTHLDVYKRQLFSSLFSKVRDSHCAQ